MDYKVWAKAAVIRALKTWAETAGAVLVTAATMGEADWTRALSAATLASIISLLWSIKGLPEVEAERKLQDLAALDDVILGDNGGGIQDE